MKKPQRKAAGLLPESHFPDPEIHTPEEQCVAWVICKKVALYQIKLIKAAEAAGKPPNDREFMRREFDLIARKVFGES